MSHSKLRAERAKSTFWAEKKSWKSQEWSNSTSWSFLSNSVTRQVNFNNEKLVENAKITRVAWVKFYWWLLALLVIIEVKWDFFLVFQPQCIGITLRRSCIMIAAFLSRLYGSVGALQDYYSADKNLSILFLTLSKFPVEFSPQSYLIGEITHNKPRQTPDHPSWTLRKIVNSNFRALQSFLFYGQDAGPSVFKISSSKRDSPYDISNLRTWRKKIHWRRTKAQTAVRQK